MDLLRLPLSVIYDADAGVLIGQSDALPGLIVEASTLDELRREAASAAEMLLLLSDPPGATPRQVVIELAPPYA